MGAVHRLSRGAVRRAVNMMQYVFMKGVIYLYSSKMVSVRTYTSVKLYSYLWSCSSC